MRFAYARGHATARLRRCHGDLMAGLRQRAWREKRAPKRPSKSTAPSLACSGSGTPGRGRKRVRWQRADWEEPDPLLLALLRLCLLVDRSHAAAVLRPAAFVRLGALRTLLAVGDHGQTAGIDAQRGQVIGDRIGATLTERQVVLAGAALVAVAFDGHGRGGILREPGSLLLELRLRFCRQIIAVGVEEHAIADILLEILSGARRNGALGNAGIGRTATSAGIARGRSLVGGASCQQQRCSHRRDHLKTHFVLSSSCLSQTVRNPKPRYQEPRTPVCSEIPQLMVGIRRALRTPGIARNIKHYCLPSKGDQ